MQFQISLPFSIPLIFKKKIIIAEEYSKDAISLNLLPTQQIRRATLSRSNEPDTRDRSASFAPSLSFSLCEEIVRTIRCGRKKRRRRRRGGEKKLAGSYLTATERCGPFYLPPPPSPPPLYVISNRTKSSAVSSSEDQGYNNRGTCLLNFQERSRATIGPVTSAAKCLLDMHLLA